MRSKHKYEEKHICYNNSQEANTQQNKTMKQSTTKENKQTNKQTIKKAANT